MVQRCENDSHFPHLPFLIPINIVIHIRAILDFQYNLYFQETGQTPEFFIKRAVFPVKSKLQKPFWPLSDGINLKKVNFNYFILDYDN